MPASPPASSSSSGLVNRNRLLSWVVVLSGTAAGLGYGLVVGRLTWAAPLVLLGLGGLVLGLTALALWRVVNPLVRTEASVPEPPRAPARVRELEREKQMVLKAIKEIELDYQMRKITEQDWKDMTQRYRARAMRILSELDAGDDFRALIERELQLRVSSRQPKASVVAAAVAESQVICPRCATVNEADAVFCKKCAAKLQGGAS